VKYPYVLVLEVYNEAGEKVKTLADTGVAGDMSEVLLMASGKEAYAFNASSGPLTVFFPGLDANSQAGGVSFAWDGRADNGQNAGQGVYHIKATVTDSYGHVNTKVMNVQLLRVEEYARLSVYNTAGELVARVENASAGTGDRSLEMPDVIYTGYGAAPQAIKYSEFDTLVWDGRNLEGRLVMSGTYEVVLEIKAADGYSMAAVKTISVLCLGGPPVPGEIKAYPNPVYADNESSLKVTIAWENTQPGRGTVRIYSLAGELVRKLDFDTASGKAVWDLKTSAGNTASSGLYLANVTLRMENGGQGSRTVKIMVINRFDTDDTAGN